MRKLFFLLIVALWHVTELRAEHTGYEVKVSDERITLSQGRVTVAFTLDLGNPAVRSQHKRVITPVLVAEGREQALSPVVVSGRKRALKEEREGIAPVEAYITLKGARQEQVGYTATFDYDPWMEEAVLMLREEMYGCACGHTLLADGMEIDDDLFYTPAIELTDEAYCEVEYTLREEKREAYLIYPVNRTVLLPDLYGNRDELDKIDDALAIVAHDPAYEIRSIDIAGFASPEGRVDHNIWLAEERAKALKNYVLAQHDVADSTINVVYGAENWEGLVQALETFELPYKGEILDIIADVDDLDLRKSMIRKVGGGLPYQTLLNAIYPGLRKNTFSVTYISRERSPEEARELVFTNPGELNVHEFYTVAHTFYADDPEMYRKVLTIAADTYPDHSVANNNAAREALKADDLEAAEHYLLHTRNEPYTWNNRAILEWRKGHPEEAVRWWTKAKENGDERAAQNMEELLKRGY